MRKMKAAKMGFRDMGVGFPPQFKNEEALREKAAQAIEKLIKDEFCKDDRLATVEKRLFLHQLAKEIRG